MPQPTPQQAMQAAIEHHRAGRLGDAEKCCQQVLSLSPNDPQALFMLGKISAQLGRPNVAAELLARSVAINPRSSWAHYELGCVLTDLKRPGEAQAALTESLRLNPNAAEAHNRLGNLYFTQGQFPQAIASYRQAALLQPQFAGALGNLGNALAASGDFPQAIEAYQRALAVSPANPFALCNLANALSEMGRLDEATSCYKQALTARPDFAQAHYNFGVTLARQGQFTDAAASFRKAIALLPDYAEAHADLGNALTQLWQVDDGLASCARAIELRPDFAQGHYLLGNAFKALGRLDEAISQYRKAITLRPHSPEKHSGLLLTMTYQESATAPALLKEAQDWAARFADPLQKFSLPHDNDRSPDRPLRIGFLSGNFRSHVCAYFLWPLIQHLDRRQFKVYCYAQVLNPDAITQKFRESADQWRSTVAVSDEQLAAKIRADKIDILIDAMGHTDDNRLLVLARKPAPVQATWLGYIGTTGMSAIDYRITDNYVDPQEGEHDNFYVEKSLRLPDSLWCYDPMTGHPQPNALPAQTTGHITFGSLNHFFKINDSVLTTWSRILNSMQDSRLILPAPEGGARQHAADFFKREGIDPARIEFLNRQSRHDYFQTYYRIDIALDPFPWNGHTTSLDSWWMGVPIVTLIGQTPVGRAGFSFASNLQLPQLAAKDKDEYVQIATRLAADVTSLATLRSTLRERMQSSPLMNAPRFARSMESAYRRIWQHWCNA